MDLEKLALAGMTDAEGSEAILTGSLPFSPLVIPWHTALAGDELFWEDLASRRTMATDQGALDAFVRIKKPNDVLSFARRYGPLGLCEHGKPPWHKGEDGERRWCPPYEVNADLRWGRESLSRWYDYVDAANTLLSAAAEWKINPEKELGAGLHKWSLKTFVGVWLADAGIRLDLVRLDTGNPSFTFSGSGVFGAIGLQLLQAITANNLAVCSGCGKPYLREGRKPQTGRRNYCPECSRIAGRFRMRALRSRQTSS